MGFSTEKYLKVTSFAIINTLPQLVKIQPILSDLFFTWYKQYDTPEDTKTTDTMLRALPMFLHSSQILKAGISSVQTQPYKKQKYAIYCVLQCFISIPTTRQLCAEFINMAYKAYKNKTWSLHRWRLCPSLPKVLQTTALIWKHR